jgi:hypothetical protein
MNPKVQVLRDSFDKNLNVVDIFPFLSLFNNQKDAEDEFIDCINQIVLSKKESPFTIWAQHTVDLKFAVSSLQFYENEK